MLFSLFLDRLEKFVSTFTMKWTYQEQQAIELSGLLIYILLFADDIVLLAQSHDLDQWLLASLSLLCEQSGLTISLTKMEWILGGLGS